MRPEISLRLTLRTRASDSCAPHAGGCVCGEVGAGAGVGLCCAGECERVGSEEGSRSTVGERRARRRGPAAAASPSRRPPPLLKKAARARAHQRARQAVFGQVERLEPALGRRRQPRGQRAAQPVALQDDAPQAARHQPPERAPQAGAARGAGHVGVEERQVGRREGKRARAAGAVGGGRVAARERGQRAVARRARVDAADSAAPAPARAAAAAGEPRRARRGRAVGRPAAAVAAAPGGAAGRRVEACQVAADGGLALGAARAAGSAGARRPLLLLLLLLGVGSVPGRSPGQQHQEQQQRKRRGAACAGAPLSRRRLCRRLQRRQHDTIRVYHNLPLVLLTLIQWPFVLGCELGAADAAQWTQKKITMLHHSGCYVYGRPSPSYLSRAVAARNVSDVRRVRWLCLCDREKQSRVTHRKGYSIQKVKVVRSPPIAIHTYISKRNVHKCHLVAYYDFLIPPAAAAAHP